MSAPALAPTLRGPVIGINFGNAYASIAVVNKVSVYSMTVILHKNLTLGGFFSLLRCVQEGHADCIANEDGERQIACAVSYSGEQVVSLESQALCLPLHEIADHIHVLFSTSVTVPYLNWSRIRKTPSRASGISSAKSLSMLDSRSFHPTYLCNSSSGLPTSTPLPSTPNPTLHPS